MLTEISPAEAKRRRDEREREETERYFERLSPQEALYQKIKSKLDQSEREHVEKLRERRLAGDRNAHYGHDLYHAVQRGLRREQEEAAKALFDKVAEAREGSKSVVFAGALTALIKVAAREGVSAEKMRMFLESNARSTDHFKLERIVEREGPKEE